MPSNNNNNSKGSGGTKMTSGDASRIQSGQAKGGHDMSSGGFAARAQAAGARNDNAGTTSQGTGAKGNKK